MKKWISAMGAVATAALLTACGGGGSAGDGATVDLSGSRGSLISTPITLAELTPAAFQAAAPASLFQVAGAPKCTISFKYFQYGTVGAVGEKTMASGGIMVPSGTDAACQGPRPVLLYAHGTSTDKNKNMASPQDGEAALIAAIFAAQGYIVVSPNYAGYEASTLSYHPYLVADQQSKDMMDALAAARKSFASIGANANSKLFVSGYSQGGHVALATVKAMQASGMTVTASAPMSGPYNLGFFGDTVFGAQVNGGASLFTPLLNTAFQKAYGDIYTTPSQLYAPQFATGIETLLPSTSSTAALITAGKLPQNDCMFEGASGYGFCTSGFLVNTSYRTAVLADASANAGNPSTGTAPAAAHPLRRAAYRNALMNFTLTTPSLFCGGSNDPTVFYSMNTTAARGFFASQAVLPPQALVELNVDSSPTGPTDPFAAAKVGFGMALAAAGTNAPAQYHGALVPPFCNAAARGFFANF
ncbi:lipase family protein [Variovorax sp. PCZ-1]|uniref:alpha/beta hydrolase family protein n=1 Tax=Variovorax sp. PCZ-1 TaxID=2835533 RepID=UPI001BCD3785|nr:lipase family protein [Variovorax sp. PCZ-1]MBS7809111.1 prolyl oligopeptidase family serine peptidase [Variovorax sp. PCZ-1]